MRAVVYDKYGPPDVLRLAEVEQPVPKDDEVLVKVHATTVNRTDTGFRSAEYFISRFFTGLLRPKKIPGYELAGEVEAVGAAVSEFEVGDRVFGANVGNYGAHSGSGGRTGSTRAVPRASPTQCAMRSAPTCGSREPSASSGRRTWQGTSGSS